MTFSIFIISIADILICLPWLAWLLARFFTFLGTLCATDGHTLFAECLGDYRLIQVTADAVGLVPGLFILIGIAVSLLLKENPSWKSYFRVVVLWVAYLVARYVLFLWIFLGWAEKTDISMMWKV